MAQPSTKRFSSASCAPGSTQIFQSAIDEALSLCDRAHPSAPLPALWCVLLPDPLSEAGRRRFEHRDLLDLAREDRLAELRQLAVALAVCPGRMPPEWFRERLSVLQQSLSDGT